MQITNVKLEKEKSGILLEMGHFRRSFWESSRPNLDLQNKLNACDSLILVYTQSLFSSPSPRVTRHECA